MKVYNYHPVTKVLLNESEARQDPLEKGKFLIPALSTIKEPIKAKSDEECFFDGEWKVRKIKVEQPTKYHTWNDKTGWSISEEDQKTLDDIEKETKDKKDKSIIKETLKEIDMQSIRLMREILSVQNEALNMLESKAKAERAKLEP